MERPQPPGFRDRSGAERLRDAVAELPLRYAPFYARLAELWRVTEPQVESELARARDASSWSSTPFRGLRTFLIDVGQLREAERARLLSFAPGARFPRHQHRGSERVLVLEGSYADSGGCEVGPGQEQEMPAGSEHELLILGDVPCVAAVIEHGIDFSGPWLRLASRLWRR